MLRSSAKTFILSAVPSPSVSSTMEIRSRPLPLRLHLVGVVDRLGDVEPAEVVPGHRDRLEDPRLGDEQLRLEPARQGEVLDATPPAQSGFCILRIGSPSVPQLVPGVYSGISACSYSNGFEALRHARARVVTRLPCSRPSGCLARRGHGSPGGPRCGRRGHTQCRRRVPCRACGSRSRARSRTGRRGSGGRGGPSCYAWCGRRSRPRCGRAPVP